VNKDDNNDAKDQKTSQAMNEIFRKREKKGNFEILNKINL